MTLVEGVRQILFKGGEARRDHCNGIFQWGRQIRLHSQYSRGKWGFIAEGQGRGSGWKPLRENIRGRGIPTEGRPG